MSTRRAPAGLFAQFGSVTLVAGAAAGIVAGTLTDQDLCTIILSRGTTGGVLGFLSAPLVSRGAGVSTFSIASTSVAETSQVFWMAVPKNPGLGASLTNVNTASLSRSPSGLEVFRGVGTLVAGVFNLPLAQGVPFKAGAAVFCMARTFGGLPGKLNVPQASINPANGTFSILSNSVTDTSTVDWVVVSEPIRFSPSGRVFSQSRGNLSGGSTGLGRMFQIDSGDTYSVLASMTTPVAPGNLSCPAPANRLSGSAVILSDNAGDTSAIEALAF